MDRLAARRRSGASPKMNFPGDVQPEKCVQCPLDPLSTFHGVSDGKKRRADRILLMATAVPLTPSSIL